MGTGDTLIREFERKNNILLDAEEQIRKEKRIRKGHIRK